MIICQHDIIFPSMREHSSLESQVELTDALQLKNSIFKTCSNSERQLATKFQKKNTKSEQKTPNGARLP